MHIIVAMAEIFHPLQNIPTADQIGFKKMAVNNIWLKSFNKAHQFTDLHLWLSAYRRNSF